VVTGHTDVRDLDVTLLTSTELIPSDEVHVDLGMKDMHHSRMLALESQTL